MGGLMDFITDANGMILGGGELKAGLYAYLSADDPAIRVQENDLQEYLEGEWRRVWAD